MSRCAVVGESGSGKSRLCREFLAPAWNSRGFATYALDPLRQPWPVYWQTDNPERFLEAMKNSTRCVGFVDEAQETMRGNPQRERDMAWLGLQSRNKGHVLYFLAQRIMQLPPNVRNQCTEAYIFRQTADDAEWLAVHFQCDALRLMIPTLERGVCVRVGNHKTPEKMRVF
jgi:hypothetical protein